MERSWSRDDEGREDIASSVGWEGGGGIEDRIGGGGIVTTGGGTFLMEWRFQPVFSKIWKYEYMKIWK